MKNVMWNNLGRLLVGGVVALALGCGSDDGGASALLPDAGTDGADGDQDVLSGDDATTGDSETQGDTEDTAQPEPTPFSVRGTVEQIYVWNAPADAPVVVTDSSGATVAEGITDELGSLVVRELTPGPGYQVTVTGDSALVVDDIEVLSIAGSAPNEAFYADQKLVPGFQYITMRDGTTLSVFVSLPGPPEDGPYPTIVNYSGYSPSKPGEQVSPTVEPFCDDIPVLCNAPGHPAGLLAGVGGYASVGVNMRGTGCSGGAYDYFEPLQLMDGYDVIEIVSRQSWVKHNKVGMAGLSYPGITQLFVAKTRPPGLAAIAPMSVLADSASSTLAPGGIYNDGFAIAWVENVLKRALPYGHKWIETLVEQGDTVCEENQLLHGQMVDVVQKAFENPYYTDEVAMPVDPSAWVDTIDVPVFLTGQWQDEQTGPHFAALLDKFTSSPMARFTVTNGVHADGYMPQQLMEWKTFLDLYVAREVPFFDATPRSLVPLFYAQSAGAPLELPPNRFELYTDYEEALAAYEAEPPLRIIWETGADDKYPAGAAAGRFETFHEGWPLPTTTATRWYFQPDGSLSADMPPEDGGASVFHHNPDAGTRTTLASGSVNVVQPDWDWPQLETGSAVAYETNELEETLVMVGHGSVDLWVRSNAPDADLEVQLSEIRPDGEEMLVQSGWLRASQRALRDDATELRPVKTHREEDVEPLPVDEWTLVRVELMPFQHIFRAGSRIRLSVDTPGDSCAEWFFILLEQDDSVAHRIGQAAATPSSVVLPVVSEVQVDTALPDCGALRGQPCRTWQAFENLSPTE